MKIAQTVLLAVGLTVSATGQEGQQPRDNIGHQRHLHRHNAPHPVSDDTSRLMTNRQGHPLKLPSEDDAFQFVVFGDRTGGPAVGVSVLADAVRDVNLLEPDFVMTVGDLIEGYGPEAPWLRQMREYRDIMDQLLCPWFPVAGNHDTYWRGPEEQRPEGEHDATYEKHFGPLWYAFAHKNCWFIVLYTDEGDPETGEKTFRKRTSQKMSSYQFSWLQRTLEQARGADHVFVFVHHPRWLRGNYGSDWERVHELLVNAGNVSAVFAGHIHRMRSDPRDGIEYVTMATTGGHQRGSVPEAGWLHHYNIVTVRKQQIALAAVPVGEVMDVREINGRLVTAAERLTKVIPDFGGDLQLAADGGLDGAINVTIENPTPESIEVTLTPDSADSRWFFHPDHVHKVLKPHASLTQRFTVEHLPNSLDRGFRMPELLVGIDLLAPGQRYTIPEAGHELPLFADLQRPQPASVEHALRFDGDDCLRVASSAATLPDGPMTLECWFNADRFSRRTGLVTKTENSEYGLFVSNGVPSWSLLIGDSYLEVSADRSLLKTGTWHHLAGVYDGKEARLYLDGRVVATGRRSGVRRTNKLPLYIGADVDGRGRPMSYFEGMIDAVHLSSVARYSAAQVQPVRRPQADAHTRLLINADAILGSWVFDESSAGQHPRVLGKPELVAAE